MVFKHIFQAHLADFAGGLAECLETQWFHAGEAFGSLDAVLGRFCCRILGYTWGVFESSYGSPRGPRVLLFVSGVSGRSFGNMPTVFQRYSPSQRFFLSGVFCSPPLGTCRTSTGLMGRRLFLFCADRIGLVSCWMELKKGTALVHVSFCFLVSGHVSTA